MCTLLPYDTSTTAILPTNRQSRFPTTPSSRFTIILLLVRSPAQRSYNPYESMTHIGHRGAAWHIAHCPVPVESRVNASKIKGSLQRPAMPATWYNILHVACDTRAYYSKYWLRDYTAVVWHFTSSFLSLSHALCYRLGDPKSYHAAYRARNRAKR